MVEINSHGHVVTAITLIQNVCDRTSRYLPDLNDDMVLLGLLQLMSLSPDLLFAETATAEIRYPYNLDKQHPVLGA